MLVRVETRALGGSFVIVCVPGRNCILGLDGRSRLVRPAGRTASIGLFQTLGRLHQTADVNRERLSVEAARLEQHAYRSWMDCGVAAILLLVCVTFVAMVLVMRLFVKPSAI